jgi:hypothetical protein
MKRPKSGYWEHPELTKLRPGLRLRKAGFRARRATQPVQPLFGCGWTREGGDKRP